MPANRPVNPGEEPVEFRPLPGQEEDWAFGNYVQRPRLWDWLGIYPVAGALLLLLLLMGMVAL